MELMTWCRAHFRGEQGAAAAAADELIRCCACVPGNARVLFCALEQTGDEKYRAAIQQVKDALDAQGDMADAPLSLLCQTLPFRMAYEMQINRMEQVGQAAAMFRSVHLRPREAQNGRHSVPLQEDVLFLLALTEGIDACSDQLYEHWRTLVDIYRETLRGVLAELPAAAPPTQGLAAWALLRGVELGLIDPERYLPLAKKVLSNLRVSDDTAAADLLEHLLGRLA